MERLLEKMLVLVKDQKYFSGGIWFISRGGID